MATTEIEPTVREVMSLLLAPAEVHAGDIRRSESPSWDSLKHVELVFAVEDAFQVTLEDGDLAQLDSLDRIVAAVRARLRNPGDG